jgi:hypothetical protein
MPTGSFANSFMAAKDYAEQERAKGREPSQRELAMVASAGRDDAMFALKRQMVKNQANADALKISVQQKLFEAENTRLEGMTHLADLMATQEIGDPQTIDNAVRLSSQYNLPPEAIQPLLQRHADHLKMSGNAEFATRVGKVPASKRSVFSLDKAPTPEDWATLGVIEDEEKQRLITEKEVAAESDLQRRLELVRVANEGRKDVAGIQAANKSNPHINRLRSKVVDEKAKLANYTSLAKNGQKHMNIGGPLISALAKASADRLKVYQEDLAEEESNAAKETEARIKVFSPQGTSGTILESELDEYLSKGFKQAE